MRLTGAFAEMTDPHAPKLIQYPLVRVIAIALCAMLAGADDWGEVAAFGQAKADWFATWLCLPHGIPAHDTFGRICAWLDPQEFMQGFRRWVQALQEQLPVAALAEQPIRAIDGKQCRRSHERLKGHPALHEVRVWASESRLTLAKQAVETKSNEITGCLVTIDAMGCQTAIAQPIVEQRADYVLALKGNQGTLEADGHDGFATATATAFAEVEHQCDEGVETGHGRRERRRATIITDPATIAWIHDDHHWPGLTAIGRIESERRLSSGEVTHETRYYLSSARLTASQFQRATRLH